MKKILLFLIIIFLMSTVSCSAENEFIISEDVEINTSESIKITETEDTNYIEETTAISDEDMDIPGVAMLDKSEPKNITETSLFDKNKNLYPKVDGSTALLPLMAYIRKNVLDEKLEDAENATSCTRTNEAWYNLSNGNADVLIVGEMPGEVRSDLRNFILSNKQYHKMKYAPILKPRPIIDDIIVVIKYGLLSSLVLNASL